MFGLIMFGLIIVQGSRAALTVFAWLSLMILYPNVVASSSAVWIAVVIRLLALLLVLRRLSSNLLSVSGNRHHMGIRRQYCPNRQKLLRLTTAVM